MFKKYFLGGALLLALLIPSFSFAANSDSYTVFSEDTGVSTVNSANSSSSSCKKPTNLTELFDYALCLLGSGVIPFLVGLGLVIFLVGVVSYVRAGDNEEKRQAGRDLMIFGIVALFVMVGVWGFVKILYTSFFDSSFEVNSSSPIKFTK